MHIRLARYDNRTWRRWLLAGFALLAVSLLACAGSDDEAANDVTMSEPGMTSGGVAPSMGAPSMDGDFAFGTGSKEESSSPSAPVFAGESGQPQPIADVLGRQVIRNGSVDLTVESVGDAFDQVRGIVDQAGGYLASSSFSGRAESERARMTVRIPAEKFDQVIADLRNLAVEVNSVSTSSQDVTEEFSDLQASLRNLRAVESQYLTLLGEANNIGDILQVQDRLNGVRYELERIQGRLNLLENQTSLATLEIALFPEAGAPPKEPGDGFVDQVKAAWQSSLDFIGAAATGVVVALVWSWWLIPIVVIALIVGRRTLGRLTRRATPTSADRVDTPEGAA